MILGYTRLMSALFTLGLLAVLAGCSNSQTEAPEPLSITVTPESSSVLIEGEVALSAQLAGEAADEAEVEWSADGGTLSSATGAGTTWQAPATGGTYSITGKATTEDDSAETDVNVDVEDPCADLDPCSIIRTLDELQGIEDDLSSHYFLLNDIDASETSGWNGGEGFEPIGSEADPFTGSLDGLGNTVAGLFIDRPGSDYVGLFGAVGIGAEMRDIRLELDVTGNRYTGGLAGQNLGGNITGAQIDGSVVGENSTGGLVGENARVSSPADPGAISDSSSNASVQGANRVGGLVGSHASSLISIESSFGTGAVEGAYRVGGLVGHTNGGIISNSFSSGDVTATRYVGGLVGTASYGPVLDSYSTGAVTGTELYVGGLVGDSNRGDIDTSFSTGPVEGMGNVGGLVGRNTNQGTIDDSYSLSDVTGDEQVGGLVGLNNPDSTVGRTYSAGGVSGTTEVGGLIGSADDANDIADSYWDTDTSGLNDSDGGTGKSTAQMKQSATFAGWDFGSIWSIDEGADYPDLIGNERE